MCRPIKSRLSNVAAGVFAAGNSPRAMMLDALSTKHDLPPLMQWSSAAKQPAMGFVLEDPPPFAAANAWMGTGQVQELDLCMVDVKQSAMDVEAEEIDAQALDELLGFPVVDETNGDAAAMDKLAMMALEEDLIELDNLDDGFDGTEMSILYSFLDAPLVEGQKLQQTLPAAVDDVYVKSEQDVLGQSPLEMLLMDPLVAPKDLPKDHAEELELPHSDDLKSRRLCRTEGCYKRSRSSGLCISHGGGRRCDVEGCEKSSQGGNLCIRHGGGKRCSRDGCDKAAQSNFLCKAHGGGPRCQVRDCQRSSQGGGFCRSHGGGKRCLFDGCMKGTQRGDFCALHGGSRLCLIPGCTRNDRGGGLCATHGGGKRCASEGCVKPCRRKGFCSAHLRQLEGTQ